MKKLCLAFGVTISSGLCHSGSFDGPYAQLAIGVANNTSNVQHYWHSSVEDWRSMNTNNIAGQVTLGYSYNPVSIFNIAANVSYNISSDKSGQYTYTQPGWNYTINSTLKNTWAISIEPGAYLADRTLGYVKLGWSNGKAGASLNSVSTGAMTSGIENVNRTVNGFLFGVGAKQLLTENVYVGVEFSQSIFNQSSQTLNYSTLGGNTSTYNMKPRQTMGVVTLGYKF